ncbi:MAG: CRISPR-associated endoribonuclease Cas6 [Microscillaceae bacterium]|nr:CRISPR-associated endoribonuclease Cas6 [Microscillaceae bacterium]
MRVRIVFRVKNRGGYVPFHHQHLLAQLIRETIESEDNEFKSYNLFNFSGLKGQTKISRQGLHFYSSKVTLVISSFHEKFVQYLLGKLFQKDEIQIHQLWLIPELVEKESSPELGEEVKYVCISPLVLVNPELDSYYAKKFVTPEADLFSDLMYEMTMSRMEESGYYSAEEIQSFFKFQIVPDQVYLKKIKKDDKKFARIYTITEGKTKYELRGYTFPFVLYATSRVQEFVFQCGLGAYTHKGFGMLDLANIDPVKRTEVYELPSAQNY